MTELDQARDYLRIPSGVSSSLGGMRWSDTYDALEFLGGSTFLLRPQLELVLEGAFSALNVPPFEALLLTLASVTHGSRPSFQPFRMAWKQALGTPNLWRNAGVLVAEICRPLKSGPVPSLDAIMVAMASDQPIKVETLESETALDVLQSLELHLARYDELTLVHWLTHGCAPTTAAKPLAEAVESLKARPGLMEFARRSPRLAGAASLVPALDAALTLPPRKRSRAEVPQGGYADVTTRGDPDRLLPSQLALDPDDFVRRFAEHELLFFQREQPRDTIAPERVVVLDQGVRTWGGVRLALAGAALSLLAKTKFGPVRLVTTSDEDADDDPAKVAARLEASDLTAHPADALAALFAEEVDGPRDLLLLTHPRALREPAVAKAARSRGKHDRLFALTVDADGHAELGEWAAAGPVALRRFRVDLDAADRVRPENVEPVGAPTPSVDQAKPWTGDVEPIPFPFRPGLIAEPRVFGFSYAGDWLVTASRDGTLHAFAMDGSPPEVLPRALFQGDVLQSVDLIRGVRDGVVVIGRIALRDPKEVPARPFVVAHYRRHAREVRVQVASATSPPTRWVVSADMHCVCSIMNEADAPDPSTWQFFELDPTTGGSGWTSRHIAMLRQHSPDHPLWLDYQHGPKSLKPVTDRPTLVQEGTTLRVFGVGANPHWRPFSPTRDGQPLATRGPSQNGLFAGNVLALHFWEAGVAKLHLFRGPDGAMLTDGIAVMPNRPVALSADGGRVAYLSEREVLHVADTADLAHSLFTASLTPLHNNLRVMLIAEPFGVRIDIGDHRHDLSLEHECLAHKYRPGYGVTSDSRDPRDSARTVYDDTRFPRKEIAGSGSLCAVVDRLGQVLLLTAAGDLVAAFIVWRKSVAAWIPGGVYWGDVKLIGGPATPDADRLIGAAIARAVAGESGSTQVDNGK